MLICVFRIWKDLLTQELGSCCEGGGKASHLFPTFHRLPPVIPDSEGSWEVWSWQMLTSTWGETRSHSKKLLPDARKREKKKSQPESQGQSIAAEMNCKNFLPGFEVFPIARLLYFLVASDIVKHSHKFREMPFISNPNDLNLGVGEARII